MSSSIWTALVEPSPDGSIVRCRQAGSPPVAFSIAESPETQSEEIVAHAEKSVVRVIGEQLTVGSLLGFATGFSIKKIGKMLLFVLGSEVIFLQYCSYRNWVDVHWQKIADDVSPALERKRLVGLLNALASRMPFATSFTAGVYAGIKYTGS
ncbi:hypothetical protein NDN08_002416 [Rhodosorus marinus]|uniref:FUN14 domain-containing protein 1 n=1 Tax=Rhodosorus marinus TaxID=101924 RepID=A0AAV8UTQ0_9RHOD|nr:hypothetical protein NDN08_002416 [Rhodosorus marinus]